MAVLLPCRLVVFFLIALVFSHHVLAADIPFQFENRMQEERYMKLTQELRCLVCQNQSLADSHADLAQDLRNEIFKMIKKGKSNDEIIAFLVNRYGDFVLYRPPVNKTTWLLWFGPFLVLLGALLLIVFFIRSQKTREKVLSETERARVSRLLHDDDAGNS